MKFIFRLGYICCGCNKRYTKDDTFSVYKRSCICKECYHKLEKVPSKSSFAGTSDCDFVVAPFFYQDLYRNIFLKFKFNGCLANGHLLGMALAEYFKDFPELKDYDCIVPVPLSDKRLRERGFNQSEILGRYVSGALDIPMINYALKIFHTKTQSKLKGMERINNVKGSFMITHSLKGKNIIIFDDIFTTGSTINELAKEIKKAGAKTVCAITAGYVYHKPNIITY